MVKRPQHTYTSDKDYYIYVLPGPLKYRVCSF